MGIHSNTIRILHVDDKAGFADMVATFLEREDHSFEVTTATSVSEGLDRLEDTAFDCIVADYEMPGQNGIDFLEIIRADDLDLPFILFTGKGSEEIASEAISAGVTDYLQKDTGNSQYAVLANRIRNAVDQYHTHAELVDRELRLNLLFEKSPLGIIEWNTDFEVVRINQAGQDILGYPQAELRGKSWETTVPESDQDTVKPVLENLLEEQGGYHNINHNRTKSGDIIICEWHNRVITDSDDEIVTIFSLFQDITEREEQANRMERYLDHIPGFVYRCENEEGWPMERVRGDVADVLGYDAETIVGGNGFYGEEVIHPDDREKVWETVQAAISDDDPFEVVYRIETKDDEIKRVWERGQAVRSPGGDLQALEGFITDITGQDNIPTAIIE